MKANAHIKSGFLGHSTVPEFLHPENEVNSSIAEDNLTNTDINTNKTSSNSGGGSAGTQPTLEIIRLREQHTHTNTNTHTPQKPEENIQKGSLNPYIIGAIIIAGALLYRRMN